MALVNNTNWLVRNVSVDLGRPMYTYNHKAKAKSIINFLAE
jgi:hypothetical protein